MAAASPQTFNTPGYYLFLKSLTNEILRRNSSVNLNEMNKIVDREWAKLPETHAAPVAMCSEW